MVCLLFKKVSLRSDGPTFHCHCLITQKYVHTFFSVPSCKPVPPGSVPPGPSGGTFSPGLGHHAPHRHLNPVCVHRRCQGPTDASRQKQRVTKGESLVLSERQWGVFMPGMLMFCHLSGLNIIFIYCLTLILSQLKFQVGDEEMDSYHVSRRSMIKQ